MSRMECILYKIGRDTVPVSNIEISTFISRHMGFIWEELGGQYLTQKGFRGIQ